MRETIPPPVLAEFFDAQGHRVTAVVTSSGLLAILARDPDSGLRDGRPCLNRENARELGLALIGFADREGT